PKLVIHRGILSHELRKQGGTSKHMILVPLSRFEVPKRACGRWCRNFKSAALASAGPGPAQGENMSRTHSTRIESLPHALERECAPDSKHLSHFLRRTGAHFGGKCSRLAFSFAALAAMPWLLQAAPAGAAAATKVWVSSAGADGAGCGAAASPCLTFQQAVANVAAGGEVGVLRPGDYGPVTITASVSITNDATGQASL